MKNNCFIQRGMSYTGLMWTLFLFVLIIGGCQKIHENLTETKDRQSHFSYISSLGYDTTGIVDLGPYYLVEGDILIKKPETSTLPRQAITSYSNLVSAPNQVIRVRIDGSVPSNNGNFDWRSEVVQAIDAYNNLVDNSNIRMVLVTSGTTDILIQAGTTSPLGGIPLGSTTLAAAGPPSGGMPFGHVVINTGYTWHSPITTGQKLYTLVHELGHCIGFRHTNWSYLGESSAVGVGISPNTGTNPDPLSVMNGGNPTNTWIGFSNWDLYAINYLYPIPYSVSGANTLCSSSSYSVSGLPTGATVNWVANPTGRVSISNPNSSSPSITRIADGGVTLTANLQIAGHSYKVSKNIYSGKPIGFAGSIINPGPGNPGVFGQFNCLKRAGAGGPHGTYYYETIKTASDDPNAIVTWEIVEKAAPSTWVNINNFSAGQGVINVSPQGHHVVIKVTVTNSCGSYSSNHHFIADGTCSYGGDF